MWSKKIQALASQPENNGELPSIIFPSAVAYFDNDNSMLCWECANSDKGESIWRITDYMLINDSDADIDDIAICDSCGNSIDPAMRPKTLSELDNEYMRLATSSRE